MFSDPWCYFVSLHHVFVGGGLLYEHFICFPFLIVTNKTAKSIVIVSFGAYEEVFEGRIVRT